jgi:hypothetical protein
VEIKIKWIKQKQMTHENTYRDDNFHKVSHILSISLLCCKDQYFFFKINHKSNCLAGNTQCEDAVAAALHFNGRRRRNKKV